MLIGHMTLRLVNTVLAHLSELLGQVDILLLDEGVVLALKHTKGVVSVHYIL